MRNCHPTICAAQLLHAAQPVTIDRNHWSRSPEYAKISTPQKLISLSALGLLMASLATASYGAVDADAAASLAKKSDCLKCHAVDKDKKAPSFKSIAEKWKGKADAQAKLTESVTKSPKVKMTDGTVETHKAIASQDAGEIQNMVDWILSR